MEGFAARERRRFARSANNPPFAIELQRMGHPVEVGYPVESLPRKLELETGGELGVARVVGLGADGSEG